MTDLAANHARLLELTAVIVSAHVANNHVPATEVPDAIQTVFDKLSVLREPEDAKVELVPAVPVKKSVRDDHIICLEDGKPFKILKRHLMADHGLTPEEYREKWGLAYDYPMVAPSYSRRREELARKIGLGRKPSPKARARKKK